MAMTEIKTVRCAAVFVAALSLGTAGSLASWPASAQSLVDGYWYPIFDDDAKERGPGPSQGNYTGWPLTKAALSVAETWDPERLTEEAEQCRPNPSTYTFRGPATLRVWEDRDPYTQQQTQIESWISWQQMHRHIWMPAAHEKHPPWWTLHSWQGFSAGHWVGDVLHIHTDQLMPAWMRNNGLPLDDRASMDEVWFRYGNLLVQIQMVSDKQYLAAPLVMSSIFRRVPQGTLRPFSCRPADEIPRAAGIVPMHLPNQQAITLEWAVRHDVPVQASRGGVATELPEYQDYMKTLAPNPPLKVIESREQQELKAQAAGR